MKTKPFDLKAAINGAKCVMKGQPALYVGKWSSRNWPYVFQYGSGVFEDDSGIFEDNGYCNLMGAAENGETTTGGQLEILVEEPKYPDWVIKSARHHGCKWIAQDRDGGIFGYERKPYADMNTLVWTPFPYQKDYHGIVLKTAPRIDPGVDWTDSLFEVPE